MEAGSRSSGAGTKSEAVGVEAWTPSGEVAIVGGLKSKKDIGSKNKTSSIATGEEGGIGEVVGVVEGEGNKGNTKEMRNLIAAAAADRIVMNFPSTRIATVKRRSRTCSRTDLTGEGEPTLGVEAAKHMTTRAEAGVVDDRNDLHIVLKLTVTTVPADSLTRNSDPS